MASPKAVVLAAGMGSRLGTSDPKPLTELTTGETILERQVQCLTSFLSVDDIFAVVGYKKELIMESASELGYVYNRDFDSTNTAKSLLPAVRKLRGSDVLWVNGDVVMEESAVKQVLGAEGSAMAVRYGDVGDEEVKFREADGRLAEVSKDVEDGAGEAVGVNLVRADQIDAFVEELEDCQAQDYFEAAIQGLIDRGVQISPVDVSDLLCMEVDFPEDLEEANRRLQTRGA